jgi:flagellar biosynthesis protein FlhF
MRPRRAPRSCAAGTAADAGARCKDLRHLLERELASLTWNDKRLREPLKVRVLEELSALDIAPDIAMKLASLTPKSTRLENPSHIPLALLAKHLPVIADPTCINGGVVAIVGPTGVGKTTTIAKLAARWSMLHGADDLALVSTDSYRIGAREQLHDLRAHSRRAPVCRQQRQGAGTSARTAQIEKNCR